MHNAFISWWAARFFRARSLLLLLFKLVFDLGDGDQKLSLASDSTHRRRRLLRLKAIESFLFPRSLSTLLDKLIELLFECLHLKPFIFTHNLLPLFSDHQV